MLTMKTHNITDFDSGSVTKYNVKYNGEDKIKNGIIYRTDYQTGKIEVNTDDIEYLNFDSNDPNITIGRKSGMYTATDKGTVIYRFPGLAYSVGIPFDKDDITINNACEYVPGSLGYDLYNEISQLLEGTTGTNEEKLIFSYMDFDNIVFERNPNCWASSVDLTSVSIHRSNATMPNTYPVIAVTPQIVVSGHTSPVVGTEYTWVTQNNENVTRTVIDNKTFTTSYYVGLLDSPLPSTIGKAKLFPSNITDYFYYTSYFYVQLPTICTDKAKHAFNNRLLNINPYVNTSTSYVWDKYDPMSEEIIGGDSGSPIFMSLNGNTILLSSWYYGNNGSGTCYSLFNDEIKAAIDSICADNGITEYTYHEQVDLSSYPKY